MRWGTFGSVLGACMIMFGVVSAPAALASAPGASPLAPLAPLAKVALPGTVPRIPSGVSRLGAVPASQMLHLTVALASQNPAGLAHEVAAVSTPGSADFRHYLSAAQFNASYGPSAAEVWEVTSELRRDGLAIGSAPAGSFLLPVSGRASQVSAALNTPLESVRLPSRAVTVVNTEPPQVPASVAGDITAIVGLDGLAQPHSMLKRGTPAAAAAKPSAAAPSAAASHDLLPHTSAPQACSAAAGAAGPGNYTSSQLASVYGLNQLFAQGRTGVGQTIGVVEFEQYSSNDISTFLSCYGLDNAIRTVAVDGPIGGPAAGSGEAALDIEMAAVNAPSASIIVYEAPNNQSDSSSLALLNRIASDDLAQVVTTSWGICESLNASGDANAESTIFSRMASQGQTMIAASGDAGSEDCFSTAGSSPSEAVALAVDDPGSQPDVLDVGGTSLASAAATTQSVWNDCGQSNPAETCQDNSGHGAGGGGFSTIWSHPSWQPGSGTPGNLLGEGATSAPNRAVPDLSASSDPEHGVVAYYATSGGWTVFGGTSAAAPAIAGLLADTDQGCTNTLGMVGPSLYGADNSSDFTDIVTGNNDYLGEHNGDYTAATGFDEATGLGTPIDQNLAIALQGDDGCPAVSAMSAQNGPEAGGSAITISGGGLADATAVTFGSAGSGQITSRSETSLTVVPPSPNAALCVDVTVTNPKGISAKSAADRYGFGGSGDCDGYRMVASDGGIFDYGSAAFEGSTGNIALNAPIVGMAVTPSGNGYWLVASDGGVFAFGDARFYGSMGGTPLNAPIVGMSATPNGNGYWLVASDGGIFSFGAAQFWGSAGNERLNRPIVGMATTGDGYGYWLVATDGGIFTYGDAQFYGSTGDLNLTGPIVGMAATKGGNGYWLVSNNGGVFTFGNAGYDGSMGSTPLNKPIVGMAATSDSGGYWLVASDGGIFSFGDALFYGSAGNLALNKPIVGMTDN